MSVNSLPEKIRNSGTINTKETLYRVIEAVVGQTGRKIKPDDMRQALEQAIGRYGGC